MGASRAGRPGLTVDGFTKQGRSALQADRPCVFFRPCEPATEIITYAFTQFFHLLKRPFGTLMRTIWKSFRALYFAALMMLIGSGLLSTYLALRLSADQVDSLWVGALMAANYFGLALGGKIGHRLIARVGHIRAYATCAGIVGAAVLGHGLVSFLPAWLFLRVIVGLGMMCQYMVIES